MRPEVKLHDYTVYELITRLTGQGWTHVEARSRRAARTAYEVGGELQWFALSSARGVSRSYLLALATAADIGRPIPHLQPEAFCAALLEGKEYTPLQRKARFNFVDSLTEPPLAKR